MVHILYNFVAGPYGGGNQFLKALRSEFQRLGAYAEQPEAAEILLFNGNPVGDFAMVDLLHGVYCRFPGKIYLCRLDGPTLLIRGRDRHHDLLLKGICEAYMDGIIFQSEWCRGQHQGLTGITSFHETVIPNAPDRTIFHPSGRLSFARDRRIRVIATSWSSNLRKGFEVYRYLDQHLDWSRYAMTFVGNSPFEFKNIRWVKPQPSAALAHVLRNHDIYLTASQSDPCSNSLLEALHCGLPVLALNDGGHPELVGHGGLLFDRREEVPEKLARLVDSYETFQGALPLNDIGRVAQSYLDFGRAVREGRPKGKGLKRRDSLALGCRYRQLRAYFRFHDFCLKVRRKLARGVWGGSASLGGRPE
jgi:glycosyltransferase involved in cell wall biosynthesis